MAVEEACFPVCGRVCAVEGIPDGCTAVATILSDHREAFSGTGTWGRDDISTEVLGLPETELNAASPAARAVTTVVAKVLALESSGQQELANF